MSSFSSHPVVSAQVNNIAGH